MDFGVAAHLNKHQSFSIAGWRNWQLTRPITWRFPVRTGGPLPLNSQKGNEMAKGKGSGAGAAPAKEATKSKKPRFKGINHPKNCPKAFRSSGNTALIRAFLGK